MTARKILGGSLAGILLATTALAETSATATTDLNLRSGPGPVHEVISVIPEGGTVTVGGCLDTSDWCQVTRDGVEGWAYGAYLNTEIEAEPTPIAAPAARQTIRIIDRQETGATTTAGGALGAIAGAIIAGPPGALIGAAAGLGAGALAEPTTREITYVRENPLDPVWLEGEVVVGASLPEAITLTPVPDSEFTYAYVNHVPVIVEPQERTIVYVPR
ncbi:DUF1236 domain-containing protein [Pararhodobacter sp. SW119]|uniref:DUF1236 domain-containing protein n=1 Tax=Pararhodobacter sp. SW119 TaxID=2780075 RepID=UPI001ADFD959|nr:DUF1236 domain-containing protein [Pararhodobacter sp. SW119]